MPDGERQTRYLVMNKQVKQYIFQYELQEMFSF